MFIYLLHLGSGYLLIDPVNSVHCCGQIAMWHYVPVKIGNITFSVWRKIDINRYKVVGTNTVVVKGNDNMATLFSLCSTSCKERTPYFRWHGNYFFPDELVWKTTNRFNALEFSLELLNCTCNYLLLLLEETGVLSKNNKPSDTF